MNYNELTAQQCADWLAERERWEQFGGGWRREIPERREYEYRDDHPYQLTLDAAAAALREPWSIANLEISGFGYCVASIRTRERDHWKFIDGPDELTARYRAAVAARMEDDK